MSETDRIGEHVHAFVVNYQTPDLLDKAVRSFHAAYPDVPLTIFDNGSGDESPELVSALARELPSAEAVLLSDNVYHGPALHRAMSCSRAPFTYLFDSDTETIRGGFLEEMHRLLSGAEDAYGAGQVVRVNHRGFAGSGEIPVLASAYMLLKTGVYRELPPFVHHGLPALDNFRAAAAQGYRLFPFPIEDYVEHLGRGTAERYGYGLGLRSRLDYLLNRLGL